MQVKENCARCPKHKRAICTIIKEMFRTTYENNKATCPRRMAGDNGEAATCGLGGPCEFGNCIGVVEMAHETLSKVRVMVVSANGSDDGIGKPVGNA